VGVQPAVLRLLVRPDGRAVGDAQADAHAAEVVPYAKGARVLAALDVEIRTRSGGEATLQDVMAGLNAHEGTVTHDAFERYVSAAAGEPMGDWLDRYVRGPAAPQVPEDRSLYRVVGDPPEPETDPLDRPVDLLYDLGPVGVLLVGVGPLALGWARSPPGGRDRPEGG
jgi:hypothetical protein